MTFPKYKHTEVDFVNQNNGDILEASISLGMTPSDLQYELIVANFIKSSVPVWHFILQDGTTLKPNIAVGDQGVTLGSVITVSI